MMKPLVLLVLIALSCAEPDQELVADFASFYSLIPIAELRELAEEHYDTDFEFKAAADYIVGPDFRQLLDDFISSPDVLELLSKIDVAMERFYTEGRVKRSTKRQLYSSPRSLRKFLEEAERMIPWHLLYDFVIFKVHSSPVFAKFYQVISSEEIRLQVIQICADRSFQKIYIELEFMEVPVERYVVNVFRLFDWSIPDDLLNSYLWLN